LLPRLVDCCLIVVVVAIAVTVAVAITVWCCGRVAAAILRYCIHSLCRRHGRMVLSDMVRGCVVVLRSCVKALLVEESMQKKKAEKVNFYLRHNFWNMESKLILSLTKTKKDLRQAPTVSLMV
jgi:hypothetical protein